MIDFLKSNEGAAFLRNEYVKNERSTSSIAEELGTYANHVNRALRFHKIPIRSRSKAQKTALERGRHSGPTTAGHSDETKAKISEAVAKHWEERKNG